MPSESNYRETTPEERAAYDGIIDLCDLHDFAGKVVRDLERAELAASIYKRSLDNAVETLLGEIVGKTGLSVEEIFEIVAATRPKDVQCYHCGLHLPGSDADIVKHVSSCEKNPVVVRAEKAEAEVKRLRAALERAELAARPRRASVRHQDVS